MNCLKTLRQCTKTTQRPTSLEPCWRQLSISNFLLPYGRRDSKKGDSGIKQKSEHHHWILHIQINLGTKFYFRLIILICWTKFAPKVYFWYITEKVNTVIEFCIFKLTYNQFHSILRFFNVLPDFPFTTSEIIGDYYLQT